MNYLLLIFSLLSSFSSYAQNESKQDWLLEYNAQSVSVSKDDAYIVFAGIDDLNNFWKTNIYFAKKNANAYSVEKIAETNLSENCCRYHAFYLNDMKTSVYMSFSENGKNAEISKISLPDNVFSLIKTANTNDAELFPIICDDEKSLFFIRKKSAFELYKFDLSKSSSSSPQEINLPLWLREKHFSLLRAQNNKLFFYQQKNDSVFIFKAMIVDSALKNFTQIGKLRGKAGGINYLSCSDSAYYLTYSELSRDFEIVQTKGLVRKGFGHQYYTIRVPFDESTKRNFFEEESILQIFSLNIQYTSGSSEITSETDIHFLDSLADIVKKCNCFVKISSHTDNIGNDLFNKKLSQKRAARIEHYLLNKGINPSQIHAEGYGSALPLFENINTGNRAKNR